MCGVGEGDPPLELRLLDLAATLASMMGVCIPFSNIGQVSLPLWRLTGASDPGPVVAANAQQVLLLYCPAFWAYCWQHV
jgi:hypothetical protein